MKINYTNWDTSLPKGQWTFRTPNIGIIRNQDYTQVSFVVGSRHWWIIINHKVKQ